jgi:hypothetical protein
VPGARLRRLGRQSVRSAHGLDSPRQQVDPVPCGQDPDGWFPQDEAAAALARHICLAHCHFYADCVQLDPVPGSVQAGVWWDQDDPPAPHHRQPLLSACSQCAGPGRVQRLTIYPRSAQLRAEMTGEQQ